MCLVQHTIVPEITFWDTSPYTVITLRKVVKYGVPAIFSFLQSCIPIFILVSCLLNFFIFALIPSFVPQPLPQCQPNRNVRACNLNDHGVVYNRPWAHLYSPPPPLGAFVDHIFSNLIMYHVTFRWSADFLCMDKVTRGHRSRVPLTLRVA